MKRRRSKQREQIYRLIKNSGLHPSAQWLLFEMRKDFPAVNEGNLYRNIRILIDEDKIVARVMDDGIEHYDAITRNHYHFVCSECGRIIDMDIPVEEHVSREVQQLVRHRISNHTIQFFGICEECLKTNHGD